MDCPNCLYYSFQPCHNLLGSIGHTTDCTSLMSGVSALRKHFRPDPLYIPLVMHRCTRNCWVFDMIHKRSVGGEPMDSAQGTGFTGFNCPGGSPQATKFAILFGMCCHKVDERL
jgi:hypothetical protein